ncbi:hypothetical protein KUCAC02_003264 [Chaenocephalus aceratus]|uniref:Uncharacterized protein n=1 Tax=Chaenocephalus aceratus TaxID=36190 RepID=A0ACB9WKS3_CHAAC|nr:hypothetical protein KUCAC02_003264 [Chaenocephalus aceratus]
MAGCTSRCRQGVLKLIQSLQRLVSGGLTKVGHSRFCDSTCSYVVIVYIFAHIVLNQEQNELAMVTQAADSQ